MALVVADLLEMAQHQEAQATLPQLHLMAAMVRLLPQAKETTAVLVLVAQGQDNNQVEAVVHLRLALLVTHHLTLVTVVMALPLRFLGFLHPMLAVVVAESTLELV